MAAIWLLARSAISPASMAASWALLSATIWLVSRAASWADVSDAMWLLDRAWMPAVSIEDGVARVARWLKKPGDRVAVGDALVELETEKIDLEVNAEKAGVVASIAATEGTDVKIGELLGVIDESALGPFGGHVVNLLGHSFLHPKKRPLPHPPSVPDRIRFNRRPIDRTAPVR